MKKAVRRSRKKPASTAALSTELALVVGAAADKKSLDLIVLDLRKGLAFTDFFVICTGANTRQVQAIADGIQEALRKHGTKPALIEGVQRGEWILIDYFDFVVHIFTPATREFYSLEKLWGDAERIEIPA
ncbi:MAG: ribosome silencing factor [Acidobacteriota bacterium]